MTDVLFVVLAMLGVLALMLGAVFFMKKLTNRISGGSAKGLRASACLSVGQDKTIVAVRAGKKSLLIGVAPSGISTLCELDEEDMSLIEGGEDQGDNAMAGKSFSECLKYNIRRFGGEFMTPYSKKSDKNEMDDDE